MSPLRSGSCTACTEAMAGSINLGGIGKGYAVDAAVKVLKAAGITDSWATLRDTLSVQRRVTATFGQRDGRSLHVRKATVAEPDLLAIYRALGISATPGGTRKLIS